MLTPQDVIDNFEFLEDWESRYAYLVELGEALAPLDEVLRTEEHRVKGCMSQLWVAPVSDTARPAPCARHSCRKGRSVTPAMGARIRLFGNL